MTPGVGDGGCARPPSGLAMDTSGPIKVLILGGGRGGRALIDLFTRSSGVEVVGVADANPNAVGVQLARRLNIPTASSVAELIARDGANLIVDVTGDPAVGEHVAARARPDVELLGGTAARLLWTLLQDEQELRAQLQQADKLATLGTFAAQVAHDLKNPLYCIREFARFIEEEKDLARIKEYSAEILKADAYLTSIVDHLAGYARMNETGEVEPVGVSDALDQAVKMCRYASVGDDVEVVRHYEPVPPLTADPNELLQIFVNLVTNAMQAMNGTGRLTLTVQREEREILIRVQDTGPGISSEHLPRLFTAFFTTKPRGVGTGLGLTIVQALTHKYGGRVSVESEAGKGASFLLWFPLPPA
ncbi:sensor histidine kinase [Candidatus Nitrospira bockiana]